MSIKSIIAPHRTSCFYKIAVEHFEIHGMLKLDDDLCFTFFTLCSDASWAGQDDLHFNTVYDSVVDRP